jgi:hypothetical protein
MSVTAVFQALELHVKSRLQHDHGQWQPGQAEMPPKAAPAEGRPKGADAPMNQSREAHLAAWPLHSPEGA